MVKSIDIIYSLLSDFVKYYPKNKDNCKQLQTFAVLDGFSELNNENLGKSIRDYGKPYFYSKRWENSNFNKSNISFDFPAMVVHQNSYLGQYDTIKEKVSTKIYNLEIGVVDKYVQDCLDCRSDYCRDRTNEEIYRDTSNMLDGLFAYFNDVVVANVTDDNGEHVIYAHKDYLTWMDDEDIIISYSINRSETNAFHREWRNSIGNSNINGFFWKGGIDDLKGTFINLQVRIDTCPEYSPSFFRSKSDGIFLDLNCCE